MAGNKTKSDAALLSLAERKIRFEVILKLKGKETHSIDQAIFHLCHLFREEFSELFKTFTSDNGSEFASTREALQDVADVYFSHPYTSWEQEPVRIKIN